MGILEDEGEERVLDFAKKVAASDGFEHTIEAAEDKDLAYIIENSCIVCDRPLGKNEIKVVPSRYVQDRDEYVRNGIVRRRLMCVDCYNSAKSDTREKVRNAKVVNTVKRNAIIKSLLDGLLTRQP